MLNIDTQTKYWVISNVINRVENESIMNIWGSTVYDVLGVLHVTCVFLK